MSEELSNLQRKYKDRIVAYALNPKFCEICGQRLPMLSAEREVKTCSEICKTERRKQQRLKLKSSRSNDEN